MPCPLCQSSETALQPGPDARKFWRCSTCALTFADPLGFLSEREEKARYDTHENDANDPAYRNFFRPFFDAIVGKLPPGAKGLDFGAGPGPALAAMLKEKDFHVALYDKYFHPDRSVLAGTYDFIVCTETAEHFQAPLAELETFQKLLRPGGWLGILTGTLPEGKSFKDWYYPKDPTHVVFYERRTMLWIAERFRWESSFPSPNVTLFRKSI